MSEIINLNIGKAGIRIGEKFLEKIAFQHFSQKQQIKDRPQVFFNQVQNGFQSRSIFLDIDPRPIQRIQLKKQNFIINHNNLIKGTGLESDLFVTGNYQQGAILVYNIVQNIRKQVQKCDRLSGFLINNSIAGGTGGGMTACMVTKLRQYYCPYIVQQHFVIPQIQQYYSPIQIYNTVNSFHYLVQNTDICFVSQNKAFSQRLLIQGQLSPSLDRINDLHAQNVANKTSPYRFSGNINTNPRKICTNLILFPRMKFMVSSFSSQKDKFNHLQSAFKQRNHSKTKYFEESGGTYDIYTMQVNCRDAFMTQNQIDQKVKNWMKGLKINFCDFLPHSVHTSIIEPAISGALTNITFNSRNIVKTFKKWAQLFSLSFRRQAFLHPYIAGGMDKMQFTEAQSNLNDLISQYVPSFLYCEDDEFDDQYDGQIQVQE